MTHDINNKALEKLLHYKTSDPEYLDTALEYADEYADGLFMRGVAYGFAFGIMATLGVLAVIV